MKKENTILYAIAMMMFLILIIVGSFTLEGFALFFYELALLVSIGTVTMLYANFKYEKDVEWYVRN